MTVAEMNTTHADRLCRLFCNVIEEIISTEAINQAGGEAITKAQFQGLEFICKHSGCCIKDLAEGLSVSHPAAVKLVERMVARNAVARAHSESDGRVVQLRPTLWGQRLVIGAEENRAHFTAAVLEMIQGDGAQTILADIADFIRAAVSMYGDKAPSVCLHCGTAHSDECPLVSDCATGEAGAN